MSITRNIKLLQWFNFFAAFSLYSTFAVIYFMSVTNSIALGLSILSIKQIASAAFEIPTGFLSDKVGRKQTLIFGSVARLLCVLCYAVGGSYGMLALGALLDGLAMSFFTGNNEALLYDSVSEAGEDNYAYHAGRVKSMAYPALIVASILGGVLANISLPLVFWLSTIPQTMCLIIALRVVEPRRSERKVNSVYSHFKEAFVTLWSNDQLRRLGFVEIVLQGIEDVSFQVQVLFYNTLWPLWAVGLTRTVMAIGKFVSFRYSGRVITRFGASNVLIFNTLITRAIHLVSILIPTPVSPITMSSTGLLWGSIEVSRSKLLQAQFTNAQRATLYSVLSLLGSIVAGLAGLIVGLISEKFGVIPTLLLLQIFFIPIIILYIRFQQAQKSTGSSLESNLF